jgi:hypothetical protein
MCGCSHEDANATLGCNLTASNDFTGTIVVRDKLCASKYGFHSHQTQNDQPYLDCEGSGTLPGCGVIEWSQASYGPTFDAQGGGVFAMKWDKDGISVCKPVDKLVSKCY